MPKRDQRATLRLIVPAGAAGQAWLVTFTDLVCLMLTFFVMLFAMAEPDPARYQALLSGTPGADPIKVGQERPEAALSSLTLDRGKAIDLGYLGRVFESQMRANPELASVQIARIEDNLTLSVPSDLLFAPGDASLSTAGRQALFILGGVAANIGNAVDVVGHADATPSGRQWPSNWELSLARAQTVAQALRDAGYLSDITVRGQGDGQAIGTGPHAASRRVDLVVREHGVAR